MAGRIRERAEKGKRNGRARPARPIARKFAKTLERQIFANRRKDTPIISIAAQRGRQAFSKIFPRLSLAESWDINGLDV
jgi:hypothetical protein